jgi:hypothetical protein
MAHGSDSVEVALKKVDRSKHVILGGIALLFVAVLLTFGFLLAHVHDAGGNAKLLFAATGAQMAFVAACAVLVAFHVTRMTRTVLNAMDLASKK